MTANISRRSFIGASAGLAGVSLAASVAASTRNAYGVPVHIPPEARSVAAGLTAFAAKWAGAGPVIFLTRFGRFLNNRIFNCRVGGQTSNFVLTLDVAFATLTVGLNPYAHADMVLEEADWLAVLYGDYTGLAPVLAGRFHPDRDTANPVVLLAILMFVFAHIPAGANPDPDLLLRILTGAIGRGGLPNCAGQPSELQVLDDFIKDPTGQVGAAAQPPTRAPEVTRLLAEWVAGLKPSDIPKGAVDNAKVQLTSILGALYAGSVMAPGLRTAGAVHGWGESGPSTVFGKTSFCTSARNAAMVNSYLAQILEWEDWTFIAHSGASIIPVALAVGEHAGSSGAEVLTAIVAANEILARAGDVLTDVVNTGNGLAVHQIETTLVAGKLLRLSAPQLRDALGIACTQPQMTSIISWTAEAKGMLTGWPAATAVTAALLAQAGMSGNRTILENGLGYCYRIADVASPQSMAKMVKDLGKVWRFDIGRQELFTKRYPTDGFQLTSVEAVLDLRRGPLKGIPRDQLPARVRRIEMRIPLVMASSASMFSQGKSGQQALFDRVIDPNQPDWTYIALLFDGVWPVAAALADGELTYRQYREDKLRDPVIRALAAKVDEVPDLTMGVFGATARVELTDGSAFDQTVPCINTFPVREKMDIGAAEVADPRHIQAILDAIGRLETYSDFRKFTAVISGGGCGTARPGVTSFSGSLPNTEPAVAGPAAPLLAGAAGWWLGHEAGRRPQAPG
jgi:2-methylcitrate dehydratase PrpD